ncbi:MAG TPA: Na+/H+ antiporter subunit E [Chromatiaceae bacterium]|nr:Na+/H+ antiporter subunit E [Chromatiaceae bacterium]
MRKLQALLLLILNLFRDLVSSGWTTARLILRPGAPPRSGFARLSYGDLPAPAVNLLGGLITLTPGTTTLDIDLERGEMLLHLLDQESAEATLAAIRRDFLAPICTLYGGHP